MFTRRIGFGWDVDGTPRGFGVITPYVCAPGEDQPTIGFLATCADCVGGVAATRSTAPAVAVTTELRVMVVGRAKDSEFATTTSIVRAGRRSTVVNVTFTSAAEVFATSTIAFARSETLVDPDAVDWSSPALPPTIDLVDLVGCRTVATGVVAVDPTDATRNPSQSLQGGVHAIAIERAVRSIAPPGLVVRDLQVRYHRPVLTALRAEVASAHHDGPLSWYDGVLTDRGAPSVAAGATVVMGPMPQATTPRTIAPVRT